MMKKNGIKKIVSVVRLNCAMVCGVCIITTLTGCYGPMEGVDELLGRRRYAMTEAQIDDWLEENYTHSMTIQEKEEVSDGTYRYTIQDNENDETFYFYDINDGFAGWSTYAGYDEEGKIHEK